MFKKYLTCALLVCGPLLVLAQQVTTLSTNVGADDALVLDADGQLYGSHYQGSAVFKFSFEESTYAVFSDGYSTPNGLAFDSQGVLYMADNVGNKIYRIFEDGSSEIFINNFFSPSGILFEEDSDTLIVTSYAGNRIVKIAPDSSILDFAINGLLNGPVGLCYDDDGQLYVGNFTDRRIIRLSENGEQELLAQPSGGGPLGFIAYAKGYIYGTLFNQHKIYRTDLMGNDTIILGGGGSGTVDGGPGVARFTSPNGIFASPSQDTLYVSDYGTRKLRMITDLLPVTSSTSVDNPLEPDWQISPNPATAVIQIELFLDRSTSVSVRLFDASGQQLKLILDRDTRSAGQHQISVDIDNLPAGTYHVQLTLNEGAIYTRPFIKSRL